MERQIMSTESTGQVTETVAATPAPAPVKRTRKRVNIATAKVADGEIKSPTSVYEILGIPTHGYKSSSLAAYSADLRGMNLYQLQEEAYNRAVLATDSKEVLIDRLEKKFIQETSKFKTAVGASDRSFNQAPSKEESERDQAIRILSSRCR
jgi:hypothetical protein